MYCCPRKLNERARKGNEGIAQMHPRWSYFQQGLGPLSFSSGKTRQSREGKTNLLAT